MTWRVWATMAVTSLARKFSPSPMPTTSGEPRRAPTSGPGRSGADDGDAVGADDFARGVADGLRQRVRRRPFCAARFVVMIADEVRQHFGVGLRLEMVPGR